MKETKKQVVRLLKNYAAMKSEVKALEFEMKSFDANAHAGAIENMPFSHSPREHAGCCMRGGKTANIAHKDCDSQSNGEYRALRTLICNIRNALCRIDYHLSLLPKKEAIVIKMFYLKKLTWEQIADRTLWAPRSLQRYKGKGLEQLAIFYAALDGIDVDNLPVRAKVRFVSYIHEERFAGCLRRAGSDREPGAEGLLYILSGCNELWNAGAESFYNFETGATIKIFSGVDNITAISRQLLMLGYHLANGFDRASLVHTLQGYFPGLEHIHLELAIEAVKLALYLEI